MKKSLLALYVLLICSACHSQQPKTINDQNAEPRSVSSFHAIRSEDGIDLYLTQGNEEAVAVSASRIEYRDKIVTRVENGVLRIYYNDNWRFGWRDRKLRAYVSFKTLDALEGSGGSDIIVNGVIKTSSLKMDISGGSDFAGAVDVSELHIEQSGGSDVDIKGIASKLWINASGGSDFGGYGLSAEYATISASGGSDAQITVTKELTADATGGSDIDYKGAAVIKNKSSSGGSSVSKRG
jgi:hypothetical protein